LHGISQFTECKRQLRGPLLPELDLSIDRGERVCLVGRNGTGKSIMRLITGEVKPDAGKIVFQQGVKITLHPEVPALFGSVFDIVSSVRRAGNSSPRTTT
jgi:ATP-binding cassette subfamily F protein uup